MNVHTRQARKLVGWILGMAVLSPFAFWYASTTYWKASPSDVTGRVTLSGRPLTGVTFGLCSDKDNNFALGVVQPDGSFRLRSPDGKQVGALPGHYHAFLYGLKGNTSIPAKFRDPYASGLDIDIVSGWNDLDIQLH
jgi:hypothetical protein